MASIRDLARAAGRPAGPTLRLVVAVLLVADASRAAELHIRESVLSELGDRVTATFIAVVDEIGDEAHPLGEDCDLHVPLRSRALRVPILGRAALMDRMNVTTRA